MAATKKKLHGRSLRALVDVHGVEAAAKATGVSAHVIEDWLAGRRLKATPVTLRCSRTGQEWRLRSCRSAYLIVCIRGLTDWDFWPTDAAPAAT